MKHLNNDFQKIIALANEACEAAAAQNKEWINLTCAACSITFLATSECASAVFIGPADEDNEPLKDFLETYLIGLGMEINVELFKEDIEDG